MNFHKFNIDLITQFNVIDYFIIYLKYSLKGRK